MRDLKYILPPPVRKALRWSALALEDGRDFLKGQRRPARVPSKRMTFIGHGDFAQIGDNFKTFLHQHGLMPDMDILDVGCGQGRMARPLVDYLSEQGQYSGFDIVKSGIEWCQREYAGLENFTFIHADIYNKSYNRGGQNLAKDYVFPFEDDRFDLVFLTSVFTHMLTDDMDNYLSEIARVLKPGGRAIITWFLLNDVSRRALDDKTTVFDFFHPVDAVSLTTVPDRPESAIAFDEADIRARYRTYRLNITDTLYGNWACADNRNGLQDIIIADKRA